MKKFAAALLKVGLSIGLLAYLVWKAHQNAAFEQLLSGRKDWLLLGASALVCGGGVLLTLVRWHGLARALDLNCTLRDAFRLGMIGYLFNLAPMGILGGDLLKALFLARQNPGRRIKALASVVVDRIIGLYVLFLVASGAILATGFWHTGPAEFQWVSLLTLLVTLGGGLGLGALLAPALIEGPVAGALSGLPGAGPHFANAIDALRMYRRAPRVLVEAAVMTVGVHLLLATSAYLVACGLPGEVQPMGRNVLIFSLSNAASVVPIPAGPFEWVFDVLYAGLPLADGTHIARGRGLIVALGYRLVTLCVAGVGIAYYFASRREVARVLEAEAVDEAPEPGIETPEGEASEDASPNGG